MGGNVYNTPSKYFFWVDFYDFDISSENRPFDYVLSLDIHGQYFIFKYQDISFFLFKTREDCT